MPAGPLAAAAAVSNHEAAAATSSGMTQLSGIGGVLGTNAALLQSGQHPGLQRDPVIKKNPKKSQADADAVAQGTQDLIAGLLKNLGESISQLHLDVTLKLAQPDAFPAILTAGHKPGRDAEAQTELSRAQLKAASGAAGGQGLIRHNETRAEAAKTFFRQAGMVILDQAGTLIGSAITHAVIAVKHLVKVSDFDLIADTVSQHVNHWILGAQKVVALVAREFTLSIGGKTKLSLQAESEIVALKAMVLTLQEKFELTSNGPIELKSAQSITLKTNAGTLTVSSNVTGALVLSAKGASITFGPTGIIIGADLGSLAPVLAVPNPLPLPTVTPPPVNAPMPGAMATPINIGRTSGPANLPKAKMS